MYVAVVRERDGRRYELRRSVPCEAGFKAEVLLDLGKDLSRVVGFGPFGLSYTEDMQTILDALGVDSGELDKAFEPFVPRSCRPVTERGRVWKRTVLTREQEYTIRLLHPFDRRRMAYLRSGAVDLSRINEVNPKLFCVLVGKSRDELEQMFMRMEAQLSLDEARAYVHAAFNLQRYFASLTARTVPEALDPERHDEAFLQEFCAIHDDASFCFGLPGGVHDYMRRYAWLHFDFCFPGRDEFQILFERFRNDFRRLPSRRDAMAPERIVDLFGVSLAKIRSMSRRELARIFRKKAMAMHPDKGGDHDRFVELLEAYKRIVKTKPEADY